MQEKKVSRIAVHVLIFTLLFGFMLPPKYQAAETVSSVDKSISIENGKKLEGHFDQVGAQWYQVTPTKQNIENYSHVQFEVQSNQIMEVSVYQNKEKAEKDDAFTAYRGSTMPEEKAVIDFPYAWEGTYYVKVEYFGATDEEGNPLPEESNKADYTIEARPVLLPPAGGADASESESCPVELSAAGKSDGESTLGAVREFRDGILSKSSGGQKLASLYYKAAPFLIVDLVKSKKSRDNLYTNLAVISPLIADLNENGANSTAVVSNKQQKAIKDLYDMTVKSAPESLKKDINAIADKVGINRLAGENVSDIAKKAGLSLPASKSVKNKYIVKMKPGKTLGSVQSKVQGYGTLSTTKKVDGLLEDMYVIEMKGASKLSASALSTVENLKDVEYIEPLQTYKALSSDVQSPYQWSLDNTGQEISKKGADISNKELQKLIKNRTLKKNIIAVVDTGVDSTLADLNGRVRMDLGKNFINQKEQALDDNGHGTHVSGIIGAKTDNGYSMAGINPISDIMPVKVLDSSGAGDTEKIAAGIMYAANHGAKVINLSLGGSYSRTLEYALQYAASKNVVIIAASGNEGDMLSYPASSKYVISVGATNSLDIVSDYSNYGKNLDLVAPGTQIPSLLPNGNVTYMDGTSMATPHVAAVAGLLLAADTKLKPEGIRSILHETSDYVVFNQVDDVDPYEEEYYDFEDELGLEAEKAPEVQVDHDEVSGYGRLNAYSALSKVDLKAAVKPVLDNQTTLTGTAKKGSKVTVKNEKKTIGTATASAKGTFSVKIPAQTANQRLTVTITDSAKLASSTIKLYVKKGTAPAKPTVKEISDKNAYIKGTAKAGLTITVKNSSKKVLAKGKTNSKGAYVLKLNKKQKAGTKLSVTATDAAGRSSKAVTVTVKDKTAPAAPKVNKVTDKSTTVTGTAEAGSTVTIKSKNKKVGSAKANNKGKFSVKISKKKAGTVLYISAKDKAGNTSKTVKATVTKYKK